ncbi:MAG TPA: sigma-70 family RNA polymerase sigma factor [Thermomicrobiales bacterium]|jgi:RNA polymerase sigma-70 factor (ECF subfamily)
MMTRLTTPLATSLDHELDTFDDLVLLTEAKGGSLPAFNALMRRYERAVYNVATRLVGRTGAADEITQDTFLRAYSALDRFQGNDFRPWVLRIATNRSYDELRRRKRAPDSFEEMAYEPPMTWTTLTRHEDPIARIERLELGETLTAALAQLPLDQRIAVVLSDIQGYEYTEISALVGVPYGTVKSRLSRARARLRTILGDREQVARAGYSVIDRPNFATTQVAS